MKERIVTFKKWVGESRNIVFFGGAGVSTESGIPDFRSADGLYNQKYAYPPETILSHSFYRAHPEEFFRFYWDKMVYKNAKPGPTHVALACLEDEGKLKAVVTQNIDGLHQAAGSRRVLELHGSILRNTCVRCGKKYTLDETSSIAEGGVPRCDCGGIIKPDVVLYEESLDEDVMQKTAEVIANADMLIVGGTSLAVYPAAGFVDVYRGNKLVLINKSPTPYDAKADLLLNCPLKEAFREI